MPVRNASKQPSRPNSKGVSDHRQNENIKAAPVAMSPLPKRQAAAVPKSAYKISMGQRRMLNPSYTLGPPKTISLSLMWQG